MEIVLLIVGMAVGAAGLYMAAAFSARARRNIFPLMNDAEKNIGSKIQAASGEARRQMWTITEKLQEARGVARHLETVSEELRQQMRAVADDLQRDRDLIKQLHEQADTRQNQLGNELRQQMRAAADDLQRDRDLIKQLHGQAGTRQNQLDDDLARLDRRVTELCESTAQQSSQIAAIHSHIMRQETQGENSAKRDSLLLAMLEAEFHVNGKGWGGRPHLYALTQKTSAVAADYEFAAEMRDARPDALVPVERERLPDGDLIEVLAGIHWPADVVGCVLFAELADLPPRSEEDALIDADAAGQWASTRPDGRPARLAVGVCRSGEHECGLRIKGDDEIHVGTELAGDLVAALLGTF